MPRGKMAEQAWKIASFAILTAPITLSGVHPVLLPIFDVLCLTAGILLLWEKLPASGLKGLNPIGAFFLLGAYLVLQLIPLPPSWIKALSPDVWLSYQETIWAVQPEVWMSGSVHSYETVMAFFHLSALACVYLVLNYHLSHLWRIPQTFNTLAATQTLWSISSLSLTFLLVMHPDIITPWRNQLIHMRTLLTLWGVGLFPIVLAAISVSRPPGARLPLIKQLRNFTTSQGELSHFALVISAGLVFINAVCLNSWLFSLFLFCGWAAYRYFSSPGRFSERMNFKWSSTLSVASAFLGLIAFSYWLENRAGELAIVSTEANVVAPWLWSWFGSGLGAHIDVLNYELGSFSESVTQRVNIGGIKELWIGLGGVGTILMVVAASSLLSSGFKSLVDRQGNNRFSCKLKAGAFASLCLVVVLQICFRVASWNAGLFFVLLIIALYNMATCFSGARGEGVNKAGTGLLWLTRLIAIFFCSVMVSFLCLCVGSYATSTYLTHRASGQIDELGTGTQVKLSETAMYKYMAIVPFDSNSHLNLGGVLFNEYQYKEALKHLQKALENRPIQAETIVLMASLLAIEGQVETARQLISSTPVMKSYHPDTNTERLLARLLAHSEQTVPLELAKSVFLHAPQQTGRYLNLFSLYEWDLDTLVPLLPPDPIVQLQYGSFLLGQGEKVAAEKVFLYATSQPAERSYHNPDIFIQVANYFVSNSRLTEARIVVNRGLVAFPESKRLRTIRESIRST